MSLLKLRLRLHVPIPVGHRVEVRSYRRPTRARGGRMDYQGDPVHDEPAIGDLETGVVYGHGWHFRRNPADASAPEPLPELVVYHRFVARVVSCAVIHLHGEGDNADLVAAETVLTLEPMDDSRVLDVRPTPPCEEQRLPSGRGARA